MASVAIPSNYERRCYTCGTIFSAFVRQCGCGSKRTVNIKHADTVLRGLLEDFYRANPEEKKKTELS